MVHLSYSVRMTSIELEDQTAQALRAQAKARNLPLDAFLKHLAEVSTPLNAASGTPVADFDGLIDSEAGNYPSLPKSFSRADIYDDHD
jgi:hypothetical protein